MGFRKNEPLRHIVLGHEYRNGFYGRYLVVNAAVPRLHFKQPFQTHAALVQDIGYAVSRFGNVRAVPKAFGKQLVGVQKMSQRNAGTNGELAVSAGIVPAAAYVQMLCG